MEKDLDDLNDFYNNLRTLVSKNTSVNYYMEKYDSLKYNLEDIKKVFDESLIDFYTIITKLFPSVKNDTKVFIQDIEYFIGLAKLINGTDKR